MSVKDIIVANTEDMQTAIDILSQVQSEKTLVTIDGEPYEGELELVRRKMHREAHTPYHLVYAPLVVYNQEIHTFGSTNAVANLRNHIKWDGFSWVNASRILFESTGSAAVVYKGEIHLLGSTQTNYTKRHCKWNGTSWTNLGALPCDFSNGSAVVLNEEIHIIGYYGHYKWNNSSWTEVSTLPYKSSFIKTVVYNGEMHILGTGDSSNPYLQHYKWNNSPWTQVSTLPAAPYCAMVFDDKIHFLNDISHYEWDNISWASTEDTLPVKVYYASSAVSYQGEIHIVGTMSSADGATDSTRHTAIGWYLLPTSNQ